LPHLKAVAVERVESDACTGRELGHEVWSVLEARYRGRRKVELEHYLGATAINITRLDAYFTHHLLDRTHTSRLIRLRAATTS